MGSREMVAEKWESPPLHLVVKWSATRHGLDTYEPLFLLRRFLGTTPIVRSSQPVSETEPGGMRRSAGLYLLSPSTQDG